MPVFITIQRVAMCAMCSGQWALKGLDDNPAKCPHCNSSEWLWGPESIDSRLIRQGITKRSKTLNPGATSKKRVEHGRNQWRQFRGQRGEKPVESKDG